MTALNARILMSFLGEIKKVVYKQHDQPGMRFSSGVDRTPEYFHAATAVKVTRVIAGFSF
jgi:hypothetical protein